MFPLGSYSFDLKFSMFLSIGMSRHCDPWNRLLGIKVLEHGVHGVLQMTLPSHLAYEAVPQVAVEAERKNRHTALYQWTTMGCGSCLPLVFYNLPIISKSVKWVLTSELGGVCTCVHVCACICVGICALLLKLDLKYSIFVFSVLSCYNAI